MKKLIAFVMLINITNAMAQDKLACWNIFSPKGSRPVLTADIVKDDVLTNISLNFKDKFFEMDGYNGYNSQDGVGEFKTTSTVVNPKKGEYSANLITSNRTSYKGNNEFLVTFGKYTTYRRKGEYVGRLILPTDLSSDFLKEFRIRSSKERSNAVMIAPAPISSSQQGDSFLRMFCVSK